MKKQSTENAAEEHPTDEGAIGKPIAKDQPRKDAAALGPDYSVDKRRDARREHTNHFTNRAPKESQ